MYCKQCGQMLPPPPAPPAHLVCPFCGCTVYQNPAPCVSVLVVSEHQVLLGQRGRVAIRPGLWCLPCGHIERDESFVAAARREVREETGLEIRPVSIINVASNHFADNMHSLVVVLLAVPLTEHVCAGDDLVEAGWFPLEGPFPDMAFQADLHIIRQYRRYGEQLGIPLSQTTIEFFEMQPTNGTPSPGCTDNERGSMNNEFFRGVLQE